MNRDDVIPILYEMALTIGGEISLSPLLSRTLQRLLNFTSFPAGFICLDLDETADSELISTRLDAAVGDYKLIQRIGETISLPKALLSGSAVKLDQQAPLLSAIPATQSQYQAFLRLPIDGLGVIILMAPRMPEATLPLTQMFTPIMAHLARAILLCRHYDQHTSQLMADSQQAKSRADFLAMHDALTSLPNRSLLLDRIQQALAIGSRNNQYGAMLVLNVDQFKQLNDIHGYETCDQLLVLLALRLEQFNKAGNTVARFGGDDFVLLITPSCSTQAEVAMQAEQFALKMQAELNRPYQIHAHSYSMTFSIGICLYHGSYDTLEGLLKNAEASVQQAKIAGRNAIQFFDPNIQSVIMTRLELEADLLRAISRQEFQLYYQLQADAKRRITGAEVLLRWNHPTRGLVPPSVFIPLAEETGAIVPIGDWVLSKACEQLMVWQNNPAMRHLQLAVNVSAVQFHHPDFVSKVCQLMGQYAPIASLIKLELTESVVIDSAEQVIQKIQTLKSLGLRFSLDDFGTGYSSLAYLKRLPLDQLKIDQSFVRDIASDPSAAVIVQTIIGMAETLGLEVIAEGLETEEQFALLMQYGCPAYQGYLLSRPVTIERFEELCVAG